MKGCRPLEDSEIEKILGSFNGKYAVRDRAWFMVCLKGGWRISEALSLKVSDVFRNGCLVDSIAVPRASMKGKIEGRSVAFNNGAKEAVMALIEEKRSQGDLEADSCLFRSRVGQNKPISRTQAWKILKRAVAVNNMTGKLGTHCLRKTFASKIYEKLQRDLVMTQRALSHRNISSTICYLSFKQEEVDNAILSL